MRSDYEISVLKELRRGNKDPEKISRKTGLPVDIVRAVLKICEESVSGESNSKKIRIDKNSIGLLIDVLILYLVLNLLIYVVWWFR